MSVGTLAGWKRMTNSELFEIQILDISESHLDLGGIGGRAGRGSSIVFSSKELPLLILLWEKATKNERGKFDLNIATRLSLALQYHGTSGKSLMPNFLESYISSRKSTGV